MIRPPVKGSGPTRITLQFRTFEIRRVAVNKPVNTGRKAKAVFFEDAIGIAFVTIQLSSCGLTRTEMNPLRGERREQRRRHLGGKILEHANGPGNEPVAEMTQREMKYREVPFWHHLDQSSRSQELGLNDRRKIADPRARKQRGRQPVVLIDRQIRLECDRRVAFSVRVNKTPGVLGPPEREG